MKMASMLRNRFIGIWGLLLDLDPEPQLLCGEAGAQAFIHLGDKVLLCPRLVLKL